MVENRHPLRSPGTQIQTLHLALLRILGYPHVNAHINSSTTRLNDDEQRTQIHDHALGHNYSRKNEIFP